MAKTEKIEAPKMKTRPIVRLGKFLISHSILVSVVCCTAGVFALLLLPVLAKNTYISENALMPGSASCMLSHRDILEANRLVNDLSALNLDSGEDVSMESRRLLSNFMSDLDAEVSYHKFQPQPNLFHPLHFFSNPDSGATHVNSSYSSYGMNVVGMIRASRGDGKEAIVLVTPYNFGKNSREETLSLSIAYAVFSLLTRVTWLAKDIIWLIADSQYGEYAPVAAWLRDYHSPVFTSMGILKDDAGGRDNNLYVLKENSFTQGKISDGFRRAGTMTAALILKVGDKNSQFGDILTVFAEASNGQMPNLDLFNVLNYLAVHRQGLHVKVEKFWLLVNSKWLEILGRILELVGNVVRSLNPTLKFGIPAVDYVDGAATLASSLYYQAVGIPTGPHGAFRDFQVDAITLAISPRIASFNKARHSEFLLRSGRLIEGVIRSVNNLLEKFHQSFFLYLLTSPSKFVSVGVYMIPFALLVAPLPLVAAALYADDNEVDLGLKNAKSTLTVDALGFSFKSWKWLSAAKEVFVLHVWGAVVSLLPYFVYQVPNSSPSVSFGIWVFLSILSLVILYLILGSPFSHTCASQLQNKEWVIVKSVTISAVFIGLLLMSIVNFATAEIGALLAVPMCLMARPLKLDVKAAKIRNYMRVICNMALCFAAFPPASFFILKGIFEGFKNINLGDFWDWMESLWAWSSATYIYITMVHLPCWVLCVHVLLHRSC